MNNSHAMNTEEFAAPATAGLVKRWRLSMAALLAAILLGFSAPVMGQAVNATLLGTVTDSSGAVQRESDDHGNEHRDQPYFPNE